MKHIKCPIPGGCIAALTNDEMNVHLFAGHNNKDIKKDHRGHWSLPIAKILGSEYIIINSDKYQDDIKCRECDKSQTKLNEIKVQNNSLQSLINSLLQNQTDTESKQNELTQKWTQSEINKMEYMDKYHKSKASNSKLQQLVNDCNKKYQQIMMEKELIQQENNALKLKLQQSEHEKNNYIQKYNASKERESALAEECKEKTLELISVKKQLRKLQLDPKYYMSWSSDDVADYLCTLDGGKYGKYSAKLRIAFNEEGVDGEAIKDIDKESLKGWGINNFKDRASIYNHFQDIVIKIIIYK